MYYLVPPMLRLANIQITQFKNYASQSVNFNKKVVGISGQNGVGKTNLLDAIYYCCFTKSYFSVADANNIQFSKDGFRLAADFYNGDQQQLVVCINRGNNKREMLFNDIPYTKFSQHLGVLPVVMIAPDDVSLIIGGKEERRKFIDTLLSQVDNSYLQQLIFYNKILAQRNGVLKNYYSMTDAAALLEILDTQLVSSGQFIYQKRMGLIDEIVPLVTNFYNSIAANDEQVGLKYVCQMHNHNMAGLLKESLQKDILLQRSNVGIHKDDIAFYLNGEIFKTTASQGQRKSLLFALKLAEYEVIKKTKGFAPMLLLDDVFEKLDDKRMQNLL
ncbi:MAG: DNA replication and repair protein RecF, partial [Ferruginibacter sp.]